MEAGKSPARSGRGREKKEGGRVSRFVFTRGENPSFSLSVCHRRGRRRTVEFLLDVESRSTRNANANARCIRV